MTDDHRHASIRATDLAISRGNGSKNVVCFQRIMAEVIQLAGKDIEQDFRIRGGVNVATFLFKQLLRSSWALVRLPLWASVMPYGELT